MRNLVICTVLLVLLGWLNQNEIGGTENMHMVRKKYAQNFSWKTWK